MSLGSSKAERTVATIGVFDGLHRGHLTLLREVVEAARSADAISAVVTFSPHPDSVLGSSPWAGDLTPLPTRLQLLTELGIDLTLVVQFSPAWSRMTPEAFLGELMDLELPGVQGLVIGYDFRFGKGRRGDARLLRKLGEARRFWVKQVPAVDDGGGPISSTRIRNLVSAGRVRDASRLLGRPYMVEGEMKAGRGLGRRHLVPTCNVHVDPGWLLPADGVYAVAAEVEGQVLRGVGHLGWSPTTGSGGPNVVEVHLLEDPRQVDRLCGGGRFRIHFIERLRSTKHFRTLGALGREIQKDIQRAEEVLGAMDLSVALEARKW